MRLTLLLLLASCATLNTAGMSAPCRDLYNACLNTCPTANPRVPPSQSSMQIDVAACTNDCNEKARSCS
jgi:hypothetical protein